MKKILLAMLMSSLFVVMTSGAQAGLINGGFETGDLTGWVTSLDDIGQANVVVSSLGNPTYPTYYPQEGNYFLQIVVGYAFEWEVVTQSLYLNTGETLEGWAAFDWRNSSFPGVSTELGDAGRVRILDNNDAVLATPFLKYGDAGYYNVSYPWNLWSWQATAPGTYKIELGTLGTPGIGGSSRSLFDFKESSSVPEPTTMLLLGLGLMGLAGIRRKLKK